MDKKVKKWFFYPYSVNLIDMEMGPPHPSVKSWNPPPVKILSQIITNWTNNGKKSILAIFAMSTAAVDIPELVLLGDYDDMKRREQLSNQAMCELKQPWNKSKTNEES